MTHRMIVFVDPCGISYWWQWRETSFTTFVPSKLSGMVWQSRSQERSLPWPREILLLHVVIPLSLLDGHFDDNLSRSRANITSGRGKSAEAKFTAWPHDVMHLMAGFQCDAATIAVRVSMVAAWSSMVIHHLIPRSLQASLATGQRALWMMCPGCPKQSRSHNWKL